MRPRASSPRGSPRRPDRATPRVDATTPRSRRRARASGAAPARSRRCRARRGGNRSAARREGSPTGDRSTTRTLELLDVVDHAPTHRLIRQTAVRGGHVLPDVSDAGGRGDGAGDGRIRNDEFQDELRPAGAVDLGRPGGKRVPLDPLDQGALAERPIDDDAHTAVAREREDARLDAAVEDVVGDLDEIERPAAHDLLDLAMAAALRGRDPDVAQLASGL